jgi:hypothetical protein
MLLLFLLLLFKPNPAILHVKLFLCLSLETRPHLLYVFVSLTCLKAFKELSMPGQTSPQVHSAPFSFQNPHIGQLLTPYPVMQLPEAMWPCGHTRAETFPNEPIFFIPQLKPCLVLKRALWFLLCVTKDLGTISGRVLVTCHCNDLSYVSPPGD